MKLFYIFLVSLFFSCNNAKDKDVNNDSNKMDINQSNIEDFAEFSSADIPLIFVLGEDDLKQYSDLDTISSKAYDLDKVIYDLPSIGIEYSFNYNPETDTFTDKSFELKADNGKNFTVRELLFKINKETFKDLSKENHNILEGLLYVDTKNDIQYYELMLGS